MCLNSKIVSFLYELRAYLIYVKVGEFFFFLVNTKNISSHVLKISTFSLVLRTREITDIFNTFDEIYLVFTSKK